MKDIILEKFFEYDRWKYAIEKGVVKKIDRTTLYNLTNEEMRAKLYSLIKNGMYAIKPPHTAQIPKNEPGEFRTVFVNEPDDRIILSIANDLLFELMPEKIHSACKSYQKGIGCGKIVKQVSEILVNADSDIVGFKADLSKYFDSVPIEYIDREFDDIESKYGKSALIDVIRNYYHFDVYFDEHKEVQQKFQSLKQGCAVASYLADAVLFFIDDVMSRQKGYYVRYSDDILYLGDDYENVMELLKEKLSEIGIKLNPKKVEILDRRKWFRFLGYSIKGDLRSLSADWLKNFQKEIELRTIRKKDNTFLKARNAVNRYLYVGNGEFSTALQMLPFVNCEKDLHTLDMFVLDALRAVSTGKKRIGGLGYTKNLEDRCFLRGKGRNVKANRQKTEKHLDGVYSLVCMQKLLLTSRDAYDSLILCL